MFKAEFSGAEEEANRKKIFLENAKNIRDHNQTHNTKRYISIVTMYSKEEREQLLGPLLDYI